MANAALLWLLLRATRTAAKAKERERQASLDFDAMAESEDVASKAGPDTLKLGDYWRRMRAGR